MALILGFKGGKGLHNSSISIIDTDNDDILFVGEEERFCGKKHTDFFPISSILYILNKLNIDNRDIEYVSIANDDSIILSHYYEFFKKYSEYYSIDEIKNQCFNSSIIYAKIKRELKNMFPRSMILNINHHDTHTSLAFHTSNFDEAAYFTADGMGEFETMTFGYCQQNKLHKLRTIVYPNSLGFMYTNICHMLGFGGPNPEGKIMALASFGIPKYLDEFEKMYHTSEFNFEINHEYVGIPMGGGQAGLRFEKVDDLFGKDAYIEPNSGRKLEQIHFDIAASLQKFFENVIISLSSDLYKLVGSDNIVVGGGSFLNSVVNNKIINNTPFKNIFINPASHDGGNSLGAALYTKHNILKKRNKTADEKRFSLRFKIAD